VTRTAQTLVLSAIGGVALRIGITSEYANYVNEWMRWPLVVSGVLLIGLALVATLTDVLSDDHPTGPVAWLLVLPVVIGFVVQPPALGAYVADRRSNQVDPSRFREPAIAGLEENGENVIPVSNFVARAATDDGSTLVDVTVRLTGFVTVDDGEWHVTRLSIACCAADAAAFRVQVDGAEAPPEEQWVDVVGTWVEGTGTESGGTPVLAAEDVTYVDRPKRPYE
jgi:uncharacterized repeat protein (TIGR03943 family)